MNRGLNLKQISTSGKNTRSELPQLHSFVDRSDLQISSAQVFDPKNPSPANFFLPSDKSATKITKQFCFKRVDGVDNFQSVLLQERQNVRFVSYSWELNITPVEGNVLVQ